MFQWLKKLFVGPPTVKPPREVTLVTLGVGDVVVHLDTTYVVEQRITYHSQGFFWFDYRLDDGDGSKAWLSVSDDDELEVAFYVPVEDLIVDIPPPNELTYDGVTYSIHESAKVDAKIDRAGTETRTVVDAWDYKGGSGRRLGVQRWGEDEIEVAIDRKIQPVEVDILPGSA